MSQLMVKVSPPPDHELAHGPDIPAPIPPCGRALGYQVEGASVAKHPKGSCSGGTASEDHLFSMSNFIVSKATMVVTIIIYMFVMNTIFIPGFRTPILHANTA
jgi:hypothetical protein